MPDDLRSVYDAVQALRRRKDALQTVPEAEQAFRSLLAEELQRTGELRNRLEELRQEEGRRTARAFHEEEELSPLGPDLGTATIQSERRPRKLVPAPRAVPLSPVRRRVGRQVRQFHFVWGVDDNLLSVVNQVVADENRPLGEALAMLPWDAFAAQTGESEAVRAKRLEEWYAILVEYRGWLESKVNQIEMQYRDSLGIWERWLARDRDPEGQDDWKQFTEEARKAELATAARLQEEIKELEARLRLAEGKR